MKLCRHPFGLLHDIRNSFTLQVFLHCQFHGVTDAVTTRQSTPGLFNITSLIGNFGVNVLKRQSNSKKILHGLLSNIFASMPFASETCTANEFGKPPSVEASMALMAWP